MFKTPWEGLGWWGPVAEIQAHHPCPCCCDRRWDLGQGVFLLFVSETGQWHSVPCRALWIQAACCEWNVKHISKPAKTRTAFFFLISISSEQRKNPTCHQLPALVWRCGASQIISIRYLLSGSHESGVKERSFVGMTCLEIYLSKANSSCSFFS